MQLFMFILTIIVVLLFLFLISWKFYFLRNPASKITKEKNVILSPANGNIARIYTYKNRETKTVEKGLFGKIHLFTKDVAKEGYIILICLHVYNVHWQQAPIDGKVEKIIYTKGKFLNAVKNVADMQCFFENERNEILISGKIKCKVIQIAGYLARRIECFVQQGQEIKKGEVLGLINFGSQTALIVPKIKLRIKEGDIVRVGEIIGAYK